LAGNVFENDFATNRDCELAGATLLEGVPNLDCQGTNGGDVFSCSTQSDSASVGENLESWLALWVEWLRAWLNLKIWILKQRKQTERKIRFPIVVPSVNAGILNSQPT